MSYGTGHTWSHSEVIFFPVFRFFVFFPLSKLTLMMIHRNLFSPHFPPLYCIALYCISLQSLHLFGLCTCFTKVWHTRGSWHFGSEAPPLKHFWFYFSFYSFPLPSLGYLSIAVCQEVCFPSQVPWLPMTFLALQRNKEITNISDAHCSPEARFQSITHSLPPLEIMGNLSHRNFLLFENSDFEPGFFRLPPKCKVPSFQNTVFPHTKLILNETGYGSPLKLNQGIILFWTPGWDVRWVFCCSWHTLARKPSSALCFTNNMFMLHPTGMSRPMLKCFSVD